MKKKYKKWIKIDILVINNINIKLKLFKNNLTFNINYKMGVPLLFSTLVRNYNDTIDSKNSIIKPDIKVDNNNPIYLFLDFNAGIYQVITPEIKTEDTLVLHTLEYLDRLTKIIPNLTHLFIALDGVPCRAKIEQQRMRRHHSICKKNRTNKINKQFGNELDQSLINSIDTNMITPGTTFMYKLNEAIKKHISTNQLYENLTVIFTDSTMAGEGEHKIMHYIKQHHNELKDANCFIYGLDADLILLSMSLHLHNIYLLREANEYGNFAKNHNGKKYLFLDINILVLALVEHFKEYTGNIDVHKIDRIIDDYIFLCMLLGNDFMPKVHWMCLSTNGYEKLLSAYFQIYNHTEKFLVDANHSMTINTEMLCDILFIIKEQEQSSIIDLFEKRQKIRIPIKDDMSEREAQQIMADFYPLQHLYVEQEINPYTNNWQSRYYKICFNNMISSNENIEQVCKIYLKTLVWNFLYYFDECPSWDWYYPYSYSPTLTDIYNTLLQFKSINPADNKQFLFEKSQPIDSQTLLLMVLPWASKKYMALDIQTKLESEECPIKIYFPKKYGINVAFHRYYHECTPIIYKMEMKKIKTFMKIIKLSPDEIERNKVNELFIKS